MSQQVELSPNLSTSEFLIQKRTMKTTAYCFLRSNQIKVGMPNFPNIERSSEANTAMKHSDEREISIMKWLKQGNNERWDAESYGSFELPTLNEQIKASLIRQANIAKTSAVQGEWIENNGTSKPAEYPPYQTTNTPLQYQPYQLCFMEKLADKLPTLDYDQAHSLTGWLDGLTLELGGLARTLLTEDTMINRNHPSYLTYHDVGRNPVVGAKEKDGSCLMVRSLNIIPNMTQSRNVIKQERSI